MWPILQRLGIPALKFQAAAVALMAQVTLQSLNCGAGGLTNCILDYKKRKLLMPLPNKEPRLEQVR